MEKIYHANLNQKKVRVAILLPGKIDVKVKIITRETGTLCNDNNGVYPPKIIAVLFMNS